MADKKAARHRCNEYRANGSGRTNSIVSNMATFRLFISTFAFFAACMAVPTFMALLKQWGCW